MEQDEILLMWNLRKQELDRMLEEGQIAVDEYFDNILEEAVEAKQKVFERIIDSMKRITGE